MTAPFPVDEMFKKALDRGAVPHMNPIEQVFAKIKHLMRKAAERSHEATWRRIGNLLDTFSAVECANYLKNSGYAQA